MPQPNPKGCHYEGGGGLPFCDDNGHLASVFESNPLCMAKFCTPTLLYVGRYIICHSSHDDDDDDGGTNTT